MEALLSTLPTLIEYGGSAANLALVVILVYVLRKNGNGNSGIQEAVKNLGDNHFNHLSEDIKELTKKTDGIITNQAIQTEILRSIERNTR